MLQEEKELTKEELSCEEQNALNGIQGGLQGRMDRAFSMAYSALDVFEFNLRSSVNPVLYKKLEPFLQELNHSLLSIERLSAQNTALAINAALQNETETETVDLLHALRLITECANEELSRYDMDYAVTLIIAEDLHSMIQRVNWGVFTHMVTNLFSNSIKMGKHIRIVLECTDERHIRYHDNGTGLPHEVKEQLEEGNLEEEMLRTGKTGLLLIRQYVESMGWQMKYTGGEGMNILFTLPEQTSEAESLEMESDLTQEESRRLLCRRILHRECQATLFGADAEEW